MRELIEIKFVSRALSFQETYEVLAEGANGTVELISVPPMMWIPAQQVSVVAGSEMKLVCFVESHPEALTFWEHNGRMLQPSSRISIRNQIGSPRYKVPYRFEPLGNLLGRDTIILFVPFG